MGTTMRFKRILFVLTLVAMVALGTHYCTGKSDQTGAVGVTQAVAESTKTAPPPVVGPLGIAPGSTGFADIAEAVTPAVVNVFSERIVVTRSRQSFPFGSDPFFDFFGRRFFSVPRERRETSLGSGVIVDPSGIVLTNNHVIEGAQEIHIALADGREFGAKLLGTDPATDVAVLEIQGAGADGDLPSVQLGNSDAARIGDLVLAIGNPFGIGQTVTMGIISATGRYDVGVVDYENFIQTDAAINPGNSGGALIDLNGRLIGINTAIFSRSGGYQGIGFAIPSNIARDVMESIIRTGRVARGWLGLSFQDIDDALQRAFGLEDKRGAIVNGTTPAGPADRAGIEQGDVIVSFQDEAIIDANDLRRRIALAPVGSEVVVGIVRGGREQRITVTVAETTTEYTYLSNESDEWVSPIEGVVVEAVDRQTARRSGLREGSGGVIIKDILPRSPASYSGLRPGDIILEINRKSIASVEDFKQLVGQFENQAMILLVSRGGRLYYLSLP
ncbi:MAG: DegQ family serine endoprotease [Candidatus Zixiibacteriota bacterium]